jgi:16S rRNA (cytosine967-C5)-methyltransferase
MGKKFSIAGPRGLALECVSKTVDGGLDAQAALDVVLSSADIDSRDRGFVTELFYGYLRMRIRINRVLGCFLSRPEGLPIKIMQILGLASHEILHMDRVPAYASVDWGVDAAKAFSKGKLGGLANAVLRKVARVSEDGLDEDFFKRNSHSELEELSACYSCPEWIVDLWLKSYGRETALNYLEAQIKAPAAGFVLDVRDKTAAAVANFAMNDTELLEGDGAGFAFPSGYRPESFSDLPGHLCVRQSYAARQALASLDPLTWDTPVWDACAGRGGKSRYLVRSGIKNVLASDPHQGRLAMLDSELPDLAKFRASAIAPPLADESLGTVLLDVPCSGLGVLSRRPDTKFKRSLEDTDSLVVLQSKILDNCWNAVKKGGKLAYITCTLNPDENESQISKFIARTADAEVVNEWSTPEDSELNEFLYSALLEKK